MAEALDVPLVRMIMEEPGEKIELQIQETMPGLARVEQQREELNQQIPKLIRVIQRLSDDHQRVQKSQRNTFEKGAP